MFPITLTQMEKIVGGTILRGNTTTRITSVGYMDSRRMGCGKAFIIGMKNCEHFDINNITKACSVVIATEKWKDKVSSRSAFIEIASPRDALWAITAWQRSKTKAEVIGITGSAGKTTTKEMIASVLSEKYRTIKSIGNYNMPGSMPMTILRINRLTEAVVLEMGTVYLGFIKRQCDYAKPSIGVITNVAEAHAGTLGDSLESVVQAKQEMVDGIGYEGTLIINADDPGTKKLDFGSFKGNLVTFGIKNDADIMASGVSYRKSGMKFIVDGYEFSINSHGEHNVYNALAAISVGKISSIPNDNLKAALLGYRSPNMRQQISVGKFTIINDTFNANPLSMKAGLKVLNDRHKGNYTVAVLGNIAQLGSYSEEGHRSVGEYISTTRIKEVTTLGEDARYIGEEATSKGYGGKVKHFSTNEEVVKHINSSIPKGAVLYFKASRVMKLEDVIKGIN